MILFKITYIILAVCLVVTTAEFSAKERIRMHKEWLERRGVLKLQQNNLNDNSTKRSSYFRRIINMTNSNENISTDDRNINRIYEKNYSNDVYPEYDQQRSLLLPNDRIQTTTILKDDEKHQIQTTSSIPIRSNFSIEQTSPAVLYPSIIRNPITTTTSRSIERVSIENPLLLHQRKQYQQHPINSTTKKERSHSVNRQTGKRITKLRKYPHWGPWTVWSECSRSCGGGVMFQFRRCITRKTTNSSKRVISKECAGLYKRYRLCNEQDCPTNEKDFRNQQCSKFDDHLFQGKKYNWESYIKDDAECELNCKPIGMKYFATLNNTVIDGTPCNRPAEYYRRNYRGRAICVDGICKAVHASGILTGSFANSGTVPCGGLICRPISGIFTKNPLPNGYVSVALIPPGASNISITELKNSMNFLVLKGSNQKFIFNGDYTISPSGLYEAAGTVFDYRRIDGLTSKQDGKKLEGVTEWITCTGPTTESIYLMVFGQDPNPGIKYEYLLPITSNSDSEEDILDENLSGEIDYNVDDSKVSLKSGDYNSEITPNRPEKRRRRFLWKVVGFSPCSKSCGGGSQTPIIRCVRENPTRYFSARRCSRSEKPILNENLLRCNTQPCPAYWHLEEWGDCQCIYSDGQREREIRCVQELATGIVIQVSNAACMEEEPPTKKSCDCPKLINRRRNHYRTDRQRLHAHARAPDSIIANSTTVRRVSAFESDKNGFWLTSNWNQHCSVECGTGVEHRSIFCDRSPPNTDRCDLRITPDTTRPCENERACESGEWFTGSWGQCNGNCFNLTRSREVICISKKNQLIVDENECKENEKPITLRNCTFDEVEYCKPRWHYSEWTDCTKTCDGGNQRRTVKCLELNLKENTLRESQKCRYSDRESIYRGCNTEKCHDPKVDLIQNDITPICVDNFKNCPLVVKARLCDYDYYRKNCCYSCNGNDYDDQ